MRIGFFTDTYHPQDNGVVYVIDDLRNELLRQGHEVYIICPSEQLIGKSASDPYIIRVRSLPVVGPDATRLSVFVPQQLLKKIKPLRLDLIHMHTPSTLGIMAAYVARKLGLPLVIQHHTDIYQYAEHYLALKAGVAFSSMVVPLAVKPKKQEHDLLKQALKPNRHSDRIWSQRAVEQLIRLSYGAADAVIVQSRKSLNQIAQFTDG
ncbi:MAG: glycosyltransferase, partial [Coriobacteriia bacterium]|nr:glycosyltransferase [Coriobacteriia bacterium]